MTIKYSEHEIRELLDDFKDLKKAVHFFGEDMTEDGMFFHAIAQGMLVLLIEGPNGNCGVPGCRCVEQTLARIEGVKFLVNRYREKLASN